MPIRFRCAYCNQLLGIARRKAGKVVRCPNCAGQVVVPDIEEDRDPDEAPVLQQQAAPPAPPPPPAPEQLFERSDFDEILKPVKGMERPAPSPMAPPGTVANADPGINVEQLASGADLVPTLEPMAPLPGIWLSPAKATLLSVLAVLALTLAFVIGLMVGLFFRSSGKEVELDRHVVPAGMIGQDAPPLDASGGGMV